MLNEHQGHRNDRGEKDRLKPEAGRNTRMKWIGPAILTWLALLPALAQTIGPGRALTFDGAGAYVAIATTGSLSGTFTVELWARPDDPNAVRALLSSRFLTQEFGFDMQLGAWLPFGSTRIHADIGNGSYWITTFADADFPYSPGEWHHIAYVISPSVYHIYADGVLVGTGAVSENDAILYDQGHQLGIGHSAFPNSCWQGELDEVRIWSTARSAAEIQANMGGSLTGTEPGLMGYWRFDEGSGTTVADASGHGFDGTLVDGPAWVDSTAPIGSQPIGPLLNIQRSGSNKIVVHWPAFATGFILQETSTLRPPAWADVADAPIEIGGQNVVVISPLPGNGFYRLKK
jgi:hypothetical protein